MVHILLIYTLFSTKSLCVCSGNRVAKAGFAGRSQTIGLSVCEICAEDFVETKQIIPVK